MDKKLVVAGIATLTLLLSAAPAFAQNANSLKVCEKNSSPQKCQQEVRAVPEIDAASGAQAIALIVGVLLLGAEPIRRRAQGAR